MELNDQRFIDINIDSENESSSAPTIEQTDTNNNTLITNAVDLNLIVTSPPTNGVINNSLSSTEKRSIFKFSKTKTSPQSPVSTSISPRSANQTEKAPNSGTTNSNGINLQSALRKFSPINKSPPANLTLSQAADLLLSNLNEIGLNDYYDEDEDDDDEDDLDDDELENDNKKGHQHKFTSNRENSKSQTQNKSKITQSESNESFDFNKKDNFLNSSTISSLNEPLHDKSGEQTAKKTSLDNLAVNFGAKILASSAEIQNESSSSIESDDLNQTISNFNDDNSVLNKNEQNNIETGNKLQSTDNKLAATRSVSLFNNNNKTTSLKLLKTNSVYANALNKNESLVEGLLGDIYDRFNISFKESFDSDVFTELTESMSTSKFSDSTADHESECRHYSKNHRLAKSSLQHLSLAELKNLNSEMSLKVNQISTKLVKQLKQKDKLTSKLNRNCDVLTALLQARSLKRRVDTQMKFTLNPMPGEAGFIQWKDAMKALSRLPGGVPKEFRKSIWLNLSQQYIRDINLDWAKVRRQAFNDRSNPDDDELGIQIVKDLHRTGCSAFSGQDNEQDRALLKRVLLAFARYNKSVGYCQGFNIIAALILEIVDKKEEDALMCMIYLIDHILPEGYFTNSMHSLAIDMAVFRELLKMKLPKLCQHLNDLQFNSTAASLPKNTFSKFSKSSSTSSIQNQTAMSTYEPPLTNVFTMQWFLTLFATCLPKQTLLRVWDCVFLEGAEILFRTSIAIWDKLSISVMKANSADAFYSQMSVLSIKLFEQTTLDENNLIDKIYSYGPFPLAGLEELREKFTFNITPFQSCLQKNKDSLSQLKLANKNSTSSGSSDKTVLSSNKIIDADEPNLELASRAGADGNNDDLGLSLRKLASFDSNGSANDDDDEIEDLAKMISCFAVLMPNRAKAVGSSTVNAANISSAHNDIMMTAAAAASAFGMKSPKSTFLNKQKTNDANKANSRKESKESETELSSVTPGAFSFIAQMHNPKPLSEHLTLDLNDLKKQYKKLKERQRQAHIIIQTASAQHRLKSAGPLLPNNGNRSPLQQINDTPSQSRKSSLIPSSTNSTSSTSASNPSSFIFDPDPVVNHLLIKPNDPKRNILKKSIQLSSPLMSIDETQLNYSIKENNNYNMNYGKSLIDEIYNQKNEVKKPKKKPKPYYSDDEDDDDDDDDDYFDEDQDTDVVSNEFNKPAPKSEEPKELTLLELSELNQHYDNDDNKHYKSNSSSSVSSCLSSPTLNAKNSGETKSSADNQSVKSTKTLTNESSKLKQQAASASIIEHLIKEEKRNATPINPFPVRHLNPNLAKNGMRLGLYK